ncbi:hypothetical protein PVAP13_2NG338003 [Panicum virgatum]|uniref:Uncharacterized protein n=1 Tax=Panicum virgatum TaxID=38727 RepID=A0A8T0VEN1_PANVG|nr:hypothetical protein PVAP13_2NG338003 [Panicum virgatum]
MLQRVRCPVELLALRKLLLDLPHPESPRSKILREEDLNYLYFIWTMADVISGWILCVCPKLSKSAAYYVFAPS